MRILATSVLLLTTLLPAVGPISACEITTRSQRVGVGTIVYNTAGTGPEILLLHGLFASKEQWNSMVCLLADAGFRSIAVDLPGYGKSDGFALSAYRLKRQVKILRRFSKQLRLRRFDIAGSSMGGAIAALYLDRYPRQVRSLAFIGSPLGIVPWARGVRNAIHRGINPFIPITERQFDLELRLLFVRPPDIPEPEKQAIVAEYVTRNRHYVQVWDIVNLDDDVLTVKPFARSPTLILWGEADGIYAVAGAEKLQRRIPDGALHRLPGAGHLLLMENAEEATALYLDFLGRQGATGR